MNNSCEHNRLDVCINVNVSLEEAFDEKTQFYDYKLDTINLEHDTIEFQSAKCLDCGKEIDESEYKELQE